MTHSTFDFNSTSGRPWLVRVVEQGDAYGRNHCLTYEGGEPLVEFYDARYPFSRDQQGKVLGQFVRRYRISTLLEFPLQTGLCLDGGIPDWQLSAEDMSGVRTFLEMVRH